MNNGVGGAMREWLYKSPQEVFRCYSIGKGIFRVYLTPANVPAILPIPSFSGRAVGNVGGIDQVYVERVTQSSNDSISCSILAQGAVIFTVYVFGVLFSAVTTMGIEVVAA